MKLSLVALVALLSLATVFAAAPAAEPAAELPSVAALVSQTQDLSTLLAAAKAADLTVTLASATPITVFAPTNEAFTTVLSQLGITPAQLLSDPGVVRALLLNHVVAGSYPAASLKDGMVLTTLLGGNLKVSIVGNAVSLTSDTGRSAPVVVANLPASNGLVHVIGAVLTPTISEAAGVVPATELATARPVAVKPAPTTEMPTLAAPGAKVGK